MIKGKTLITAPAEEPVTVAEVKAAAQIDHSDEDTLITGYIEAARQLAEAYTARQFVTATWDLFFDEFPGAQVQQLPLGQLQSVDSIKYYDADGVQQTLASSVYTVDSSREPASYYLAYDQSWPTIRAIRDTITVRITAGYGAASSVPEAIKTAIKAAIVAWLENPECAGALPCGALNVLAAYQFDYRF